MLFVVHQYVTTRLQHYMYITASLGFSVNRVTCSYVDILYNRLFVVRSILVIIVIAVLRINFWSEDHRHLRGLRRCCRSVGALM